MNPNDPTRTTARFQFLVALVLASLLAPAALGQDIQQDRPQDAARAEVQARYGWPAVINLDAFYLSIDKTPEGLEKYRRTAEWVRGRALEMQLEECHSTLTFDRPLTPAELRELIAAHGVRARLAYAYVDEGGRITTLMTFIGGDAGSEGALQRLDQFAVDEAGWLGVVALVGSVPAASLEALVEDPRIFLVDVIADEAIAYNPGHGDYMQPLSWHLYHNRRDAGLTASVP
jgi:hypothetical protein